MKEGWQIKKLGEVVVETETINPTEKPNEKFIYIDVSSVNKETKQIETPNLIIGSNAPSRARKLIRTNDVIYATVRPTHQRIAVIPPAYHLQVCSTGYIVLRPKPFLNHNFLFFCLQTDSFNKKMEMLQKGANYPAVNDSDVKNINIPIPPLPEQQRIVDLLDESFAAINKAKENAQQNLKNAKELFEGYLQSVFETKGEGWEEKRFEELIQANQIGLIKSTKEQGNDKPYRYLKMDSITSDNNLIHTKYVYVDASKDELEKFTLKSGDFLFNTRNSHELVGKTCVYTSFDDNPTLFNNNIMRVEFKKEISSRFINFAFSSELVKVRLEKLKSGTTSVVGIYYKGLRNLRIPTTNFKQQQSIVSKLDALQAETKKLESIYHQKLNALEELKKSMLQKAFAGELTH